MMSCGPKVIFSDKQEIADKWTYASPNTFTYEIEDTLKSYDLQLIVDHNKDFKYENLYINASTVFPDGKKITNPVSLQMTNPESEWIGNCSGDQCTLSIDILSGAFYKSIGKYSLIIEQFSRSEILEGIKAIELKIIEHQSQK